jgi:hypothetical protein
MLKNENAPMKTGVSDTHTLQARKVYTKPHLEEIGDLRTTTLGPSNGPFEPSGGDMAHHEPLLPG